MTKSDQNEPSFNLWTEEWIILEGPDGLTRHGIRSALLHAHEHTAIYDSSPLVVVGIHRLLTAILQDSLDLADESRLEQLWHDGAFPAAAIDQFGVRYADRFDLFSLDKPFLQSADIPLWPPGGVTGKNSKSAAELFPEIPSGSLVTHYNHGVEDDRVFSPAAAAAGLVAVPPFMHAGGSGLMQSINGTPPIYVLPGGATLFEALAASLLSGELLANTHLTGQDDLPWWKRPVPVVVRESRKHVTVGEHKQLTSVGLLHGLTFPARKVRLYPERLNTECCRSCGRIQWGVRRMAFSNGESHAGENKRFWRDPFVGYRLPRKQSEVTGDEEGGAGRDDQSLQPIQPERGKAAWREFSGLFLQQRAKDASSTMAVACRPLWLDQLCILFESDERRLVPFRCVAFDIDKRNQMKYFGWSDFGLDVPMPLLQNPAATIPVEEAVIFATTIASNIGGAFAGAFKRGANSPERYKRQKATMQTDYWNALAGHFRQFILQVGAVERLDHLLHEWRVLTCREGQAAFNRAVEAIGDDGTALHKIENAKASCTETLRKSLEKAERGGQHARITTKRANR